MSDIVKGRTWLSGEVVTADKLNKFLDDAVIDADAVTTAKILDAAVTDVKLGSNAVTTGKIADVAVTDAKLASNAVTTAKIAGAAVDATKLSGAQTGAAPIYGARAWVCFDGTRNEMDTGVSTNGANVKIYAGGNVTSVLKNATGDYTVNFTVALPDENYAVSINIINVSVGVGGLAGVAGSLPTLKSTTQSRIVTASGTLIADSRDVSFVVYR
jgi:hypothetical protein